MVLATPQYWFRRSVVLAKAPSTTQPSLARPSVPKLSSSEPQIEASAREVPEWWFVCQSVNHVVLF